MTEANLCDCDAGIRAIFGRHSENCASRQSSFEPPAFDTTDGLIEGIAQPPVKGGFPTQVGKSPFDTEQQLSPDATKYPDTVQTPSGVTPLGVMRGEEE
jgi:hypothetical protein